MPVKIFVCYAHKDEELLNNLKAHLKPLMKQGLIEVWNDRDISAGTEWEQEIDKQLNTAQIILLLISPDFIASDYCYGKEMKRAIVRHDRGDARVIPVILRHVHWQGTPLGKLQALPAAARPVKSWPDEDEALWNVTSGIIKVIEELNAHPFVKVPVKPLVIPTPEPENPSLPLPSLKQQPRTQKPRISHQPDELEILPQPRNQKPKVYFQPEPENSLLPSLKQQSEVQLSKATPKKQLSGSVLQPPPSILPVEDIETAEVEHEEAYIFSYLVAKTNDYVGWVFLVLEVLLFLRFFLMLIGVKGDNPFTIILYGLTGALLAIFQGIVTDPRFDANGTHVFEWTTLIAMLVYGLLFTALMRFLHIVVSRPLEPPDT